MVDHFQSFWAESLKMQEVLSPIQAVIVGRPGDVIGETPRHVREIWGVELVVEQEEVEGEGKVGSTETQSFAQEGQQVGYSLPIISTLLHAHLNSFSHENVADGDMVTMLFEVGLDVVSVVCLEIA